MADEFEVELPKLSMGQPEISMAPLIDVVFLLLIFFMVTTVFPEKGIKLDKASAEQATVLDDKKVIISIDKLGKVFVDKKPVSIAELKFFVKDTVSNKPDYAVIIRADKNSKTDSLIQVIDICKGAGVSQLGIATDEASSNSLASEK